MRVKISYTVELEEVEREVADIMTKAQEQLDHAFHEVTGLQHLIQTQTGDLEKNLESIDFARRKDDESRSSIRRLLFYTSWIQRDS